VLLVGVPVLALVALPRVLQKQFGTQLLTIAILLAWGVALFMCSWSVYVQNIIGEQILVNEFLILLPVVIALSLLWYMTSPIQNTIAWVSHRFRLDIVLLLLPILCVWGIRETTARYAPADTLLQDLDVLFVICFVCFYPLYIRCILSTSQMQDKNLMQAVQEVGRQAGIKSPRVLVWNTHNRFMNAFAVGMFLAPKTIILTDKLLQNLSKQEIIAVAGHEFAHHKYWHLPFLFLTMLCVLLWSDNLIDVLGLDSRNGLIVTLQLVCMIAAFVLVSRLFEKQADAFPAIVQSNSAGSKTVTQESIRGMTSTLDAIACVYHITKKRDDLLHGSIQTRQDSLQALVDCSVVKIPINSLVKRLKISTVVLLILGIVV
jgi:Zn-dependent protease with chaperone function